MVLSIMPVQHFPGALTLTLYVMSWKVISDPRATTLGARSTPLPFGFIVVKGAGVH